MHHRRLRLGSNPQNGPDVDKGETQMLAMDYRGPYRVRVAQKPEPRIEHPNDAIVRVTRSCI